MLAIWKARLSRDLIAAVGLEVATERLSNNSAKSAARERECLKNRYAGS